MLKKYYKTIGIKPEEILHYPGVKKVFLHKTKVKMP